MATVQMSLECNVVMLSVLEEITGLPEPPEVACYRDIYDHQQLQKRRAEIVENCRQHCNTLGPQEVEAISDLATSSTHEMSLLLRDKQSEDA